MSLSQRQKQILIGAIRDREHLAQQTWSGYGCGTARQRSEDARLGYVLLDPARWLDRAITPSQSAMNSRAYKALEKLSLIERHNFHGERKTTHLKLTSEGDRVARQLLENEGEAQPTNK